jgi:hypothetical protein
MEPLIVGLPVHNTLIIFVPYVHIFHILLSLFLISSSLFLFLSLFSSSPYSYFSPRRRWLPFPRGGDFPHMFNYTIDGWGGREAEEWLCECYE